MTSEDRRRVVAALKEAPEWLLISHVKPDGDTLGAASALLQIGQFLGKNVLWGGADPLPHRYDFIPCGDLYRVMPSLSDDLAQRLVVTVDVSTPDRGLPGIEKAANLVVIDHHGDNPRFGTVNWIASVSSVGEMIHGLVSDLGVIPTLPMAEAIYVAIVTDTGGLSFSNTTGETLRVVAELLDQGVSPQGMNRLLYHNDSPSRLHLWGRAFQRIVWRNGVCYSWLGMRDFDETGTVPDDTETLINALMRISDTVVGVLFVEAGDDIKVSLRSVGDLSVRSVASLWGGGGHPNASGCRLSGTMNEVIDDVIGEIQNRL